MLMFFPRVPGEGLLLLLLNGHCRTFQLRSPDLSWHSGTSTASAGIKWALTELNHEFQSSRSGPQPRAPDLSAHCRTSTVSSRSEGLQDELETSVGTAGPQPRALDLNDHCRASTASSRSQLALPDLNDLSGHCRTSTASSRSQWALPDLNRELQISVALRDLNRELQISVGTAGHSTASSRYLSCRTSTASARSQHAR